MKRAGKIFLSVFVLCTFTLNLSFAQGALDGALYLDSTKFKPALNLIKDDPNFSIEIGIIDGKEYSLTVKNKITDEETNSLIKQSSNADFEDYCLNVLGIDLHAILGVKLSENQKEGNKTYTVTFDANGGVGNMEAVSNIFGTYTLPVNRFTAPLGKEFRGWSKSENGEIISGNNINISGDIVLYAIWRNKCSEGYKDYDDELNICYYIDDSKGVPVYYGVDADVSHTYNNKPISTITVFDPSLNGDSLTMMDINLGAAKTARETKGEEQYGNYYQRGNNNGFKLSLLRRDSPNLYTTEKSKYNNYRPGHPYSSSKFVYLCEGLGYWERANKDGVRVAVKYDNLRGGGEDSPTNNRGGINNGETRQGPCPNGYHVPSIKEWSTLMFYWDKTKNPSNYKDYHTSVNMIRDDKFMFAFKLSEGGYYDDQEGNIDKKTDQGFYWSSSPYNYDGSNFGYPYARFFMIDSDDMSIGDHRSMGDGLSVRCFKDSPKAPEVFTITFYENGGDLLGASGNDGEGILIQRVELGKKVQKPVDPTIGGDSVFKGWSTSKSGNDLFDFNTIISGNVDLYAIWGDLDDAEEPVLCETKTATFDFSNPYSLNPSITPPEQDVGDVLSLYGKTFKDGLVTISFVDYGMGVMLNADDKYTLNLRPGASMKVSVSGDYALKKIGFWGSVGEMKEVSSSTRTWFNQYDKDTKEMEFHNGVAGDNDTYIQKIVVTYTSCEFEKKPVDKTATFIFAVPDSLNPSIAPLEKNDRDIVSLYDKTFKDGPVSLSFVNRGNGVVLDADQYQNLNTLNLRPRASMKISVDENYELKSIGFWGSADSLEELSGYPQQTWNSILYSEKPKEIEFHNGDGDAFIPKIVVTYTSYDDSESQDKGKVLSVDPDKREPYMKDLKRLTNQLDGDKKSGPVTVCETKTATFNFSNPYSLNPSIDMPKAHGPADILSLYDKTFKDGPVTISFVDYGRGVMLNADFNSYTLNMRPRSSMKVSVSGDSALKKIGFWGSVGEMKEVSNGVQTWTDEYNKGTKEMEFHNGGSGDGETAIQKIVVTYVSCK